MPDLNGIEATRRILGANPEHRGRGPHHVRGRRLGVLRHARGSPRLRAQGRAPIRDPEGVARRGRGRGPLRARDRPSPHELLLRPRSTLSRGGFLRAHLPRAARSSTSSPGVTPTPKSPAHLFVSPKTVRNHISHIFTKLQIADRTQAILRAREAGLGGDAVS